MRKNLILSISVFFIFSAQNVYGFNELLIRFHESMYSGKYNETRAILSELTKNYSDRAETKLALANYMLLMYETSSYNDTYLTTCKKYSEQAVEIIKKSQEMGNDEVFNIISAKAIILKVRVLHRNYLTAAKDLKNIISFFEYALQHEENDKMKIISGMYNYHIETAKEDYPVIYPVVIFYPSGNKQKGLRLLNECTSIQDRNISIKSKIYLARIYRNDEKNYVLAKYWFENLLSEFPDNLFWRHEYIATLKRFNKPAEADAQRLILNEKVKNSVHINDEQRKFLQSDLKL